MLHLTYSNETEALAAQLAEQLTGARAGRSPLEPAALVVPNANIEAYLKLELAQRLGIAANLEVRYLRRFVAERVERARPGERLLDATVLGGFWLALLSDEGLLGDPALAPVHAYLTDQRRTDAVDLRRCQLAEKLGVIFDEYTLSRFEMLDAWLQGKSPVLDQLEGADGPLAEVERWQRRLWQALAGPGGLLERRAVQTGLRYRTLTGFFRAVTPDQLGLPPHLHVFGFSHVARAFHLVLAKLAQATELYVYTLNPCMEFWEDVPNGLPAARALERRGRGAVDAAGEDPFGLAADDTPALRLWGRPGRENVRLLNELSACDFTARFVEPATLATSVLGRLKRDILTRAPAPAAPDPRLADDASVQILVCPGIRREAEIIGAEIWRLLAEDPTLKLNQIAVILPSSEREAYQAHLRAVFRELHDLPHAIIDLKLASESRVVEAVELLLDLPFSDFSRQALLAVVTHPAVLARFPEVDPAEWAGFAESLGVVHGADRADHQGTYIQRDILNWDQGIRRLALGAFLCGRPPGGAGQAVADAPLFPLGDERYVPEDCPTGTQGAAATFGLLVRSLLADARFARTAELELAAWVTFLRGLIGAVVGALSGEDERALNRCHAALDALAELDLDGRRISYRTACELARARLSGLGAARGQYLASGVVVASFMPMRAIPFRVVFAAGLGEGRFPAADRVSPLDLRQARRRGGDVSTREQDKYMFLETLLSVRERLYLSYVAREALTGDALTPSSVVQELEQLLAGYRPPSPATHRRFPLRRDEDAHSRWASPPAAREHAARQLGASLRDHLGATRLELDQVRAALGEQAWAHLRGPLGLCPPPPPPAASPLVLEISLTALRRFLECPLQGAARHQIGLRDEDEATPLGVVDEAFSTEKRALLPGLREAFFRALAALGPAATAGDTQAVIPVFEEAYEALRLRAELTGIMPTGLFGAAERQAHLQVLHGWFGQLTELRGGRPATFQVLRFGRAEEHARVDRLLPPLSIPVTRADGRRVEVRLYGRTGTRVDVGVQSGTLTLLHANWPAGFGTLLRQDRESLRAFLDYAVQAAAEEPLGASYAAWVVNIDGRGAIETHRRPFAALPPDEARRWLGEVVADLLDDTHDYALPCEAVFVKERSEDLSFAEAVEQVWRRYHGGASAYGPVPHPERFLAPDEPRAQAMAARRFGPFLRGGLS